MRRLSVATAEAGAQGAKRCGPGAVVSTEPEHPEDGQAGPGDVHGSSRAISRDELRAQFIDGLGGWTGMAVAAVPTVVFVVVNALAALQTAVIAAVLSSLILAGVRLARRQSPQQALSGLFGVLVAAVIAARTGQARGYFLFGIWTSFAYGAACLATVLARRPAAGLLWEFLDPTPPADGQPAAWYRRRVLLMAYTLATLAATVVFTARGLVQLTLFRRNDTGWLAVARIAMGYPLTLLAILFAVVVVRRARRRLVPR